jgi:phosphoenolpyruvate carboxylase
MEQSLWHALPTYLRRLDTALSSQTGRGLPIDASPIRFGSWIGGDRDGNPNVTATVTREAVFLCRWTATKLLHDEVDALCRELSMDTASEALRDRAGTVREPYRALLRRERSALANALGRIEDELDGLQSGRATSMSPDASVPDAVR